MFLAVGENISFTVTKAVIFSHLFPEVESLFTWELCKVGWLQSDPPRSVGRRPLSWNACNINQYVSHCSRNRAFIPQHHTKYWEWGGCQLMSTVEWMVTYTLDFPLWHLSCGGWFPIPTPTSTIDWLLSLSIVMNCDPSNIH